jgi:hypothetical protein
MSETMTEGSSIFSGLIENDSPKKDRHGEPEIVRKGPKLLVPPSDRNSTPSEKMLDWLMNRWRGSTISTRDILQFGPGSLRDRKSAIATAEILAAHGWLIPLKTHRYDMKKWQIVRGSSQ